MVTKEKKEECLEMGTAGRKETTLFNWEGEASCGKVLTDLGV